MRAAAHRRVASRRLSSVGAPDAAPRPPSGWRRALRRLPLGFRVAATRLGAEFGLSLAQTAPPAAPPVASVRPGPVLISGFFTDKRGIGRAAELTAQALERAGIEVLRHDITSTVEQQVRASPPATPGGVWMICCNPPEMVLVLHLYPELAEAPLYRIGMWAWELPEAPAVWIASAPAVHEIWAPSRFTAQSLMGAACPVHVMPHPVQAATTSLSPLGDRATFLAFADLRSSAARKNPFGALRAFEAAFQEGEAELILKLSGVADDPPALNRLRLATARSDITLIEQQLDRPALDRLIESATAVVSLHRSEGFGLTVAEAMAAGKPVIATDWSGVTDFLPDDEVQAVPFEMAAVEDPSGRYAGQSWAEPNLDHAAASMRRLAASPELAAELGASNRKRIAALSADWTRDALSGMDFARHLAARRLPGEG